MDSLSDKSCGSCRAAELGDCWEQIPSAHSACHQRSQQSILGTLAWAQSQGMAQAPCSSTPSQNLAGSLPWSAQQDAHVSQACCGSRLMPWLENLGPARNLGRQPYSKRWEDHLNAREPCVALLRGAICPHGSSNALLAAGTYTHAQA